MPRLRHDAREALKELLDAPPLRELVLPYPDQPLTDRLAAATGVRSRDVRAAATALRAAPFYFVFHKPPGCYSQRAGLHSHDRGETVYELRRAPRRRVVRRIASLPPFSTIITAERGTVHAPPLLGVMTVCRALRIAETQNALATNKTRRQRRQNEN